MAASILSVVCWWFYGWVYLGDGIKNSKILQVFRANGNIKGTVTRNGELLIV